MRFFFASVILLFATIPTSEAHAETLKNADVIMLLEAGLGDEAVIAKIETSEVEFDTETSTLLELKEKGVPSAVIAAMLKSADKPPELSDDSPDPMLPHYTGVYILDDWSDESQMIKIDPTASTQTKTGGIFGYALTAGLASASVKAVIPGREARTSTPNRRPVFYMYFDTANGTDTKTFSTGFGGAIQTPNEFSLVELKKKKGRREARIGSMNIAGAKSGVMDKDQIPFSYEEISNGVFKVQPEQDLDKGQYGFIFAMGGGVGPGLATSAGTAGARVFGFGVDF